MSPAERCAPTNAIWLCQICAKLIDDDSTHFTPSTLLAWKTNAENASFAAITGNRIDLAAALRHLGPFLSRSPGLDHNISPRLGSILAAPSTRHATPLQRRRAVGDIVQWGRFSDGVYAPRSDLLQPLAKAFFDWATAASDVLERRHLPVFWIDGRSGNGKSVLLLQLAAEILSSDPAARIFQVSHADLLPDLITYAHNTCDDDGLHLVIVDDLHCATDDDTLNAALRVILDRDDLRVMVLACGPTPEKDAFQRAHPGVEVTTWTIPLLTQSDVQLFSDWFEKPIAVADPPRQLLVEVLFIAHVGTPIPAFARAFGNRLRRFGVFDTAYQMMAINALNVAAPIALFRTAIERDAIERLARDDQLHFEWTSETWGQGIRLVHSTIAWQLFDEWSADHLRGPSISTRLARVLAAVLTNSTLPRAFSPRLLSGLGGRFGALVSGRTDFVHPAVFLSELVALTQQTRAEGLVLSVALQYAALRPEPHNISRNLELSSAFVSAPDSPSEERVTVAMQLAVMEARGQVPQAGHRERAEALLLEREVGANGASSVCVLVWEAGSARSLPGRWLRAHPAVLASESLLRMVLAEEGPTAEAVQAASTWIQTTDPRMHQGDLLSMLVAQSPGLLTTALAISWLREMWDRPHVGHLLCVLLRKNAADDLVRQVSLEWLLSTGATTSRSIEVLALVLTLPGRRALEAIRPLVQGLVQKYWESGHLASLLPSVIKRFGYADSGEVATAWVRAHWSATGSGMVISALLKAARRNEDITALAVEWVRSRRVPDHAVHVLCGLLNTRPQHVEVQRISVEWVAAHTDCENAFDLLSTLLVVAGDSPAVRPLAHVWVKRHFTQPGARSLLCTLLRTDPLDTDAQEGALVWIAEHMSEVATGQLLSGVSRVASTDERVKHLTLRWLQEHEDTVASGQLLSTLVAVSKGEQAPRRLARLWMASNLHRRAEWQQVLAALLATANEVERPDYVRLALESVDGGRTDGEMPYLVEALALAEPSSHEVKLCIVRFLGNPRNGIRERQRVLEGWIRAGGPRGAAVAAAREMFQTRTSNPDKAQLFGILARACALTWQILLQTVREEPNLASDLCYLIGNGLPSTHRKDRELITSFGLWPVAEEAYILHGAIKARYRMDEIIEPLLRWLASNYRRKGYGVVLAALADRARVERTVCELLPIEVAKDVEIRVNSGL